MEGASRRAAKILADEKRFSFQKISDHGHQKQLALAHFVAEMDLCGRTGWLQDVVVAFDG